MILQERDGKLLFFRQTDHALLSGEFAAAWGNDSLPAPARREELLIAASRHDDGWAEWELAPKLLANGSPADFMRLRVTDHVTLYKRGIDLVADEDDYAGLVASMHGERLYTRPFRPGMDPRIQHLQGDDLEMATRYVDGEHERQQQLIAKLGDDVAEDAEEAWSLMQVWDRLSLLVCMQSLDAVTEQTFPPVVGGDVIIIASTIGDGTIELDPYPFSSDPVDFDIAYVVTEQKTWEDEASYRRDFRAAKRETLRFSCVGT